jgi:hypothetical protein
MITLPTHIQTAISESSHTSCYFVEISTGKVLTNSDWGLSAGTFRWSTQQSVPASLFGGNWQSRLILAKGGIGNIKTSVNIDEGGNISSSNNVNIKIIDIRVAGNNFREFLKAYNIRIENCDITIKYAPNYRTGAGETITLFSGKVRDWSSRDEIATLECADDIESRHDNICTKVVNNQTFTDYIIPDKTLNEFVPICYGELQAKGLLVDKRAFQAGISTRPGQSVIFSDSDFPCKALDEIYIYEEKAGGYLKLISETSSPSARNYNVATAKNEIIFDRTPDSAYDFAKDGSVYIVIYISPVVAVPVTVPVEIATYPERVYDGQFGTGHQAIIISIPAGQIGYLRVRLPMLSISGITSINRIRFLGRIIADSALTGGTISALLEDAATAPVLLTTGDSLFDNMLTMSESENDAIIPNNTTDYPNFNSLCSTGNVGRELSIYYYNVIYPNPIPSGKIDEIQIGAEITADIIRDYFAPIQGIKDPDGTITGTTGDLIEQPAHIMHHIEKAVLKTPASKINTSAGQYDTSDTSRSGWKASFQLLEPTESLELVKKICALSHSIYIIDHEGKSKVIGLEPVTTVKTITDDHIKTAKLNEFEKLLITIDQTDMENLYNNFIVNYNWDPGREKYLSTAKIQNPDRSNTTTPTLEITDDITSKITSTYETILKTSIKDYKVNRILELSAKECKDADTIGEMLKLYISFFANKRNIIKWETPNLELLAIEKGDQVQFDTSEYVSANSHIITSNEFVPCEDMNSNGEKQARLRFEAVEVL